MRLSSANLARLSADTDRFGYDRSAQEIGIVHFGIGAFHRAHQAWYTDLAMDAGDRDWAITGISLRSPDVARQLNPQNGLYSVTEQSAAGGRTRIVGSVHDVIVASERADAAVSAVAAPQTRIVSFTVTEKGYCRAADGTLDPFLAHDGSIFSFLERGMRRRRDSGLPGLTLLSCDNLADNGHQLERLMREHLDRAAPDLVSWFEAECTCPSTMVDRIVPATTAADRKKVATALGSLEDQGAVVTEPFSQWVIEDKFAGARPRWEVVGAQLVNEVAPYETAKLRMLNGAHSAIAYLGLERGHSYVHEAVADPVILPLVSQLMLSEALPTIKAAPDQNLGKYAADLLARFENPALRHRLIQIAMDGSQKIPQRWLETLAERQRAGQPCPAILAAIAAWMRHVRGDNVALWGAVDDPRADQLADIWHAEGQAGVATAMFGPNGLFASTWAARPDDLAALDRLIGAKVGSRN